MTLDLSAAPPEKRGAQPEQKKGSGAWLWDDDLVLAEQLRGIAAAAGEEGIV